MAIVEEEAMTPPVQDLPKRIFKLLTICLLIAIACGALFVGCVRLVA